MNQILFHQINITNKSLEIEYLQTLQSEGFFLLGIEITDLELASLFHLVIDPQHDTINKSDITSIEYIFNNQENIYNILSYFDKIIMCTIKPDMDSIGTMAVLNLMIMNQFHLDGDIILRLKAIAKSDRHGRNNWKNRREDYFHFEHYNIHGLPSGLAYMTSDHKIEMIDKIKNMIQYLQTGIFDNLKKYNDIVIKNHKKSIKNTELKIIIPKRLCFVVSNYRGAISYGYKHCSTVIAKNNNFIFGIGNTQLQGKKITIAQYEDSKYIDLIKLKDELNKLEPGWGGSSVILGSPQDKPTILEDNLIIELTSKYLIDR